MADKEVGKALFLLQFLQELNDLLLHGYVQGGRRLIENEDLRVAHQRPRNGSALALPTGYLVRIAFQKFSWETALHKKRTCLCLPLRLWHALVPQAFANTVPQSAPGVKRTRRCLKNHLDLRIDRDQLPPGQVGDILAVKQNPACGGVNLPGNQFGDGRLAGAGFSHDAEDFTGHYFKTYVIHGKELVLSRPGK